MSQLVKNNKKRDMENDDNNLSEKGDCKCALEELMRDVESSSMSHFIKEGFLKLAHEALNSEKEEKERNYNEQKKHEEQLQQRIRRVNILKMIIKIVEADCKKDKNKVNEDIIEKIRESRFSKGRVCPHCKCKNIWKYGWEGGKQRYKCKNKECGRTFRDTTLSPMYNSKKGIDKWIEYMRCMAMGLTLMISSEIVGINIATAFYWRHKIMDGLRANMGVGNIGGNVEIGHMLVMESTKGKKRGVYDLPRRCGTKNKYSSLFEKPKCHYLFKGHRANYILCGLDNGGNMMAELTDIRYMNQRILSAMFDGRIHEDSVVSTEGNRNYHTYVRKRGLKLGRGNTGDDCKDYNIKALMRMKREILTWIIRFKGVSSKYLNNYLYWYRFMKTKGLYDMEQGCGEDGNHQAAISLFIDSHTEHSGIRIKEFKDRAHIHLSMVG
ncbi:IS1595 family transposase [Oceanirhabdus seepicola]|uniref:IS1595 family transposase n=1 Tax=Oceanirhabdus seepicola TaxID=2828781 RepID=A0A9J6P2C4_9CLOT|nr:IS1595 family transposase [Oceanirhabdus seepicola]MCM1990548.1 IS1595 family transposase [Oceanirhabdus seepicola]